MRNFKLETSKCESENLYLNLQTSKFEVSISKNWNLKLRKWKSSKLRPESFQLLSCDKLQVLKLRIRTACSKLSYHSWKLFEYFESCRMSKLLNLENCQSWMLKVVRHWKWLNVESSLIVRIRCLLTSCQRRSYCTQSGIKWRKRSEELWKVIYSKRNSTSSRLLF